MLSLFGTALWTVACAARWSVVCAVVALLAGGAARGRAAELLHATLVSSEPAEGGSLERAPERVRLVFSEPIDGDLSRLLLVSSDGAKIRLTSRGDPTNVHAVIAPAPTPTLGNGAYRLFWRIVSADGHPVDGSFVFYIGVAAEVDAHQPSDPSGDLESWEEQAPEGTSILGAPVVASGLRGIGLGAIMAVAGALFFVGWVSRIPSPRLAGLAVWLSAVATVALGAHMVVWLLSMAPDDQGGLRWIRTAIGTDVARAEALRAVLAMLSLWALLLARQIRLAAILAMLAVAVSGAIGHPAAIHPIWAIPATSLHLIAGALWLGGLLFLIVGDKERASFRESAGAVSSVALVSVIAIAVTGLLQTILFLTAPSDLVRSPYGLLVLGKAVGLGVLVMFGARNRFRLIPALDSGDDSATMRRWVSWETAVMVAVILLAGLLAYVPVPSSTS